MASTCGRPCLIIAGRKSGIKMIYKTIEEAKTNWKEIEMSKRCTSVEIGKKYNRLTILYRTENSKSDKAQFVCLCDCGNYAKIAGGKIKSGHTKSCGCFAKEQQKLSDGKANPKDLTNFRFGKLTAIEKTGNKRGTCLEWKCKCDCGNTYYTDSHTLLRGDAISCGCLNISKGVYKIIDILEQNNISFVKEKTFDTCIFPKTNSHLRFDFYLLDYNILIEYDGEQHFKPKCFGGCSLEEAKINFEKTKERDLFKNKWCKENNIKLYRISYLDIKNINNFEDILERGDLIKC